MRLPFAWAFLISLLLLVSTHGATMAQTVMPLPPCESAPIGKGTYPHRVVKDAGEWSVYWCSDKFAHTPVVVAKKADYKMLTPSMAEMATKSAAQLYRDIWTLNVKDPSSDPALMALIDEAYAWADENKPVAPLWTVATNGTSITRPVYTRTPAGTRSDVAVPGLRAPVSTECVCSEPAWRVDSGSTVYCPWIGSQVEPVPQITLCRATPRP